MDNDDLIPKDLKDPYDRLEEIETALLDHKTVIEDYIEKFKDQSQTILRITETLKDIGRALHYLELQLQNINQRLTKLEEKNES